MKRIWVATPAGRLFTASPHWSLALQDGQFELTVRGKTLAGDIAQLENCRVAPGAFWSAFHFTGANGKVLKLDGMPNAKARQLKSAIDASLLGIRFDRLVLPVEKWVHLTTNACDAQLRRRGWLSHEFVERVCAARPVELGNVLEHEAANQHLSRQSDVVRDAVAFWRRPFRDVAAEINGRHAAQAEKDDSGFFDIVEKSALTEEQRNAVICFDSRVSLIASAGSGKTSTLVAKAGYALKRG